jgi:hypothetical protein
MESITYDQFNEIVDVISKYFCHCSGAYCSEADCDIQDIYDILYRHIEFEPVNEEEEKLPFTLEEEDDDELV